jgi:DNA-directed RNA polymerase specialized sigma24 family protein
MPLDSYELEIEDAGDRIDAERLAPQIDEAVNSLPLTQRRALEFRVLDDFSYADVASELGCSESQPGSVLRERSAHSHDV